MFFLRKTKQPDQLPIAMTGVRMGERVLQIGIDDPSLAGAIAAKAGLSGHAAIAVADEAAGAQARKAAEKAGVLVDVHVTPLRTLPFADDAFDVIVVHARSGWLASLDQAEREAIFRDACRVSRGGGRVIAIEGDAIAALDALPRAGFKATRVLAERDGYRFAEGLKPRT
jgi:ubiquinone/menaquinone biosynthesis C-methylase UbiE